MQRILSRICSRVPRHHSDDTQQTQAFTNPLAEGQTRHDQIRTELATLSARICDGHLSKVDMLFEDNGLQLGLSFSTESHSDISTETKIYSAPSGLSETDLVTCYLLIKERLNQETLHLTRSEVRRLNSIPAPDGPATSEIAASRTTLLAHIDRSNLAQVTSVGTQEPHLILGAYQIASDQDASLASLALGVLVQTGDPSGASPLRPFQPGSKLVSTVSESLNKREQEDADDRRYSEDSE